MPEKLSPAQKAARTRKRRVTEREIYKCPPGIPKKMWAEEMKRQDEYFSALKTEVIKHIRAYDRAVAAEKAKKARKKVAPKSTKRSV